MKGLVFICDLGEVVPVADNGPLDGCQRNRRSAIIPIPKRDELYEMFGGEGAK